MEQAFYPFLFGQQTLQCAYTQWGNPQNPDVVICVHGLTRNSRDFDALAEKLSSRFRVICPDIVGRGLSDPLPVPMAYVTPTYVLQMQAMMFTLGITQTQWVGTSMGGLIGMGLAAFPQSPITRMVLNDVGPYLSQKALQRIQLALLQGNRSFATMVEVIAHLKRIYAPFGPLTDEQWEHIARYSVFRTPDGQLRLAFDPSIQEVFQASALGDISLWEIWEQIHCPVLCLRGELSDLLTVDTTQRMAQTGPKARIVTIPGVGHAPALMNDEQIALVSDYLTSPLPE